MGFSKTDWSWGLPAPNLVGQLYCERAGSPWEHLTSAAVVVSYQSLMVYMHGLGQATNNKDDVNSPLSFLGCVGPDASCLPYPSVQQTGYQSK